MRQILFLVKSRSRAYFRSDNWPKWLFEGFLALMVFLYCVGGTFVLTRLVDSNQLQNTIKMPAILQPIFAKLAVVLWFIPIVFKFFPSFTLKKTVVPAIYPLSRWQLASMDLWGLSIYRTTNGILLTGVCLFSVCLSLVSGFSPMMSGQIFLILFGSYIGGMIVAENLINAIAWRKWIYLMLILLLGVITYYFLIISNIRVLSKIILGVIYFSALLQILLYYGFYKVHPELPGHSARGSQQKDDYGRRASWHMLWRNKTFRTTLLMGVAFQSTFLNYYLVRFTGLEDLSSFLSSSPNITLWLFFASPISLFTYVYGNFWGFFTQQQRNLLIISPSKENSLKVFRQILLPPLLVYELLLIINIGIYGLLDLKLLAFNLVAVIYSLAISILCAYLLYRPTRPIGFMQMRQNISPIASFSILIPLMTVGALYSYPKAFYYAMTLLTLLALSIFLWMNRAFSTKMIPKLKEQIFGGK